LADGTTNSIDGTLVVPTVIFPAEFAVSITILYLLPGIKPGILISALANSCHRLIKS
jgi:hypothetical protein